MDFTKTVFENRKALGRPFLAAHRGCCGANVPCNTLEAYEIAVRYGADVVEIDVSRSRDGKFFVFHPGMEPIFLRSDRHLDEMTAAEIEKLRLCNSDGTPTHYRIPTLAEVLCALKGKAYINVDKFWTDVAGITGEIRRSGTENQVIIKTYVDEVLWDEVERHAPDLMYMTMAWHHDDVTERLDGRNINYIGIEALFDKDTDDIASEGYIKSMHDRGLLVWQNAIIYNEKEVISGGHTDDISLAKDPALGWGWLADRGADFIQTDWLFHVRSYLEGRNRG